MIFMFHCINFEFYFSQANNLMGYKVDPHRWCPHYYFKHVLTQLSFLHFHHNLTIYILPLHILHRHNLIPFLHHLDSLFNAKDKNLASYLHALKYLLYQKVSSYNEKWHLQKLDDLLTFQRILRYLEYDQQNFSLDWRKLS